MSNVVAFPVVADAKQCIACGDVKPIGDFYLLKKGEAKRQSRCKGCDNRCRANGVRADAIPKARRQRVRAEPSLVSLMTEGAETTDDEDEGGREDDWAPRRSILEDPDDEDAGVAACGLVWSIYDRGVRERDATARGERFVWRGHFLDKRRMRALEVLPAFKAEHGRGPTLLELAALLEIDGATDESSKQSAAQAVAALKEIGAVTHSRATGILLVEDLGPASAPAPSAIDAELDAGAKALAKVDAALDRATAELALIEEPTPAPTRGASADVIRGVRRALGQRVAKQIVTTLNEEKSMPKRGTPGADGLTDRQRETLRLFEEGLSFEEIAKQVGGTAASACTAIVRLRKRGLVKRAGPPNRMPPIVKAAPAVAAHVARAPRPQAVERDEDGIIVQLRERRRLLISAHERDLSKIDGAIAALGGEAS